MRLCRFDDNRLGVVRGAPDALVVHDVTGILEALPAFRYPLPDHDPLIAALPDLRSRIEAMADAATAIPLAGLRLLPPVASPRKIVAAPVNYRLHHEEALADDTIHHSTNILPIDKAGLFLKATSSLIGASDPVVIRFPEARNDHEIELVAVIGARANRVSRHEALSYVAGYAIGLDMTVRGTQERSMRKSCDSYTVLGPWLVTADEIPNPSALDLHLLVNGETRQQTSTANLLRDVAELIEKASAFYTLMPGDLLFTGTPEGVAPVKPGDVMTARITGIGQMEIAVR
ncbi:fumarylacetoacetate hydrolase family protein [Aureimonas fodinaquatilis]|uniref:Fumarylacetoacetate hydrolase family protein n=1 Tax=Aureimonas fodinaquatilis TaxID=2565783 RepID=A0A5B0E265_9HYPH|nr:fumarylacetoacetate hydrolase family protein [Aureimonas fodinaquatilis]KAA0971830.1 fumarylacetoacetate hydrolase family protein [Aureimonas fodinaquatilis]